MMRRFLPADFVIPATVWKDQFCIRPLAMEDVVRDFTCYMGCVDYLREGGFIQPPDMPFIDFPRDDMTLREALILLGVAEYEMSLGNRVEYGLFSKDEREEFGCIYIMPSMKEGYDAQVTFWVHQDRQDTLDGPLYTFLKDWVPGAYPFLNTIIFPGRDMAWKEWKTLPSK